MCVLVSLYHAVFTFHVALLPTSVRYLSHAIREDWQIDFATGTFFLTLLSDPHPFAWKLPNPKSTIRLKCVHLVLWTTRKIELRARQLGL